MLHIFPGSLKKKTRAALPPSSLCFVYPILTGSHVQSHFVIALIAAAHVHVPPPSTSNPSRSVSFPNAWTTRPKAGQVITFLWKKESPLTSAKHAAGVEC